MLIDKENRMTYCFWCSKWYDVDTQIFRSVLYPDSLTCLLDHLIGNIWDNEYKALYREE